MSDTPHSIIDYDATHNTVIRISEKRHCKPNILSMSDTISNISRKNIFQNLIRKVYNY